MGTRAQLDADWEYRKAHSASSSTPDFASGIPTQSGPEAIPDNQEAPQSKKANE